jgi:two-component system, NtrC family, sensor kinase
VGLPNNLRSRAILPRTLIQKFIIGYAIVVVTVGAVTSLIHTRAQERQLLDAMVTGADQLSGSIVSATWHAMLADQRSDAYTTMETIAKKQGIAGIRIFNKEGRVMFTTQAADTGYVDKDAEACAMCHSSLEPLLRVDAPNRARVFQGHDGHRRLAMVTPIYNEPSCSDADCHAHPGSMKVLGVLDLSLDLSRVDDEIGRIRFRTYSITAMLLVVISVVTALILKRLVLAPIRTLIAGTKAVSTMDLDTPVVVRSSDEFESLARAFDKMRIRLRDSLEENARFTQSLETTVEERTHQLDLAHRKLMQSDRLASLGQLSASVAHEINNPLSGVLNLSMLLQRILKDDGIPAARVGEFRKYLSQVVNETARVGRIVQDLLAFSRRSKQRRGPANFNALVNATVNLVAHKLALMNVAAELHLDEALPLVLCDSSQMQQVLINLIMNGAEASQNRPDAHVAVTTAVDADRKWLVLKVSDNGEGIPPSVLLKIYDPFFTTKPEGKGIGLGLSVVYGIVDEHEGDIEVQSVLGSGTTFTVRLPVSAIVAQPGPPVEARGT